MSISSRNNCVGIIPILVLLVLPVFLISCGSHVSAQPTCPCPTLQGPSTTCPNTLQTLRVLNAPSGSSIVFSIPSGGGGGNILSQSGSSAIINQPGSFLATVCFQLSATFPGCGSGGSACPTGVTLTALGNCPTFSMRAFVANPRTGVTYTFNLRRSTASGGPFTTISTKVVGPFTTIPDGVIEAIFTGLPPGAAFYQVTVSVPNCALITSNTASISQCCPSVSARLTSNSAVNPPSLTICSTPPSMNTIIFVCTASPSSPGAIYRFLRDGVIIAQSGLNSFVINFNDMATVNVARFSCLVITQSGSCFGPESNVIRVQKCTGSNTCPTALTLTSTGKCPTFNLKAQVSNPQPSVTYTFTLKRSTSLLGPFNTVGSNQIAGPVSSVTPDGIFGSFSTSGLPPGNAFYRVEVTTSATGCTTLASNTINLPDCGCVSATATLKSDRTGDPQTLSLCDTPIGMSTVGLTCTATPTIAGALFRFVRDGDTVSEGTSNILRLTAAAFSGGASFQCLVISTQPTRCVGALSNAIAIRKCNSAGCPVSVSLSIIDECPFSSLRAVITSNPQVGVTYTFTLRRATSAAGPFTVSGASKTVGPLTAIPSGGIAATFFPLPSGSAFYIVDVSVTNCIRISSSTVSFPGCPVACRTPSLIQLFSTNNMNRACVGLSSVLQCVPEGCNPADTNCLETRFRFQLIRSSGGYIPGPGIFQTSSFFTVVPVAGEIFNCRAMSRETDCVGERTSAFSPQLAASVCPA